MKRLYSAKGMVERDALLARLTAVGIEAITPARDVSRKVTDSTIDLSLGGYSVVAAGFPIFVPDEDLDRAEDELAAFIREARAAESTAPVDYWQKYYMCALFSLTVPVIMNAFAAYHLVNAVRTQGPPRNWFYFGLATACFVASLAGGIFIGLSKLGVIE